MYGITYVVYSYQYGFKQRLVLLQAIIMGVPIIFTLDYDRTTCYESRYGQR